jgi:intracellular septation protein
MTRTPLTEAAAPPPRKALNPTLKFVLELGPLALFFAAYSKLGIFTATGVLMACVVVALGVSYAMLRRIPVMPLVTAVIVLIFGSLTLIFHDETLIKIKPTALYLLFAAALFAGIWLKKPLLKILFDGALHVTEEGWLKLTWRWAFFFVALAILNEVVWRTQSTDLWVKFKTFGFLPLTLLFALAQAPLIMRYEAKERETGDNDF